MPSIWPPLPLLLIAIALLAAALGVAPSPATDAPDAPQPATAEHAAVAAVLDNLHDAAARADGARYFAPFSPRAVFLGTDASERWTIEAFKAYAQPYFDKGQGWTYLPRPNSRNIEVHGNTAWFDEALDNAKYGQCRGTGVLINEDGHWRITQYNLTVPIPNALLPKVADLIRAQDK